MDCSSLSPENAHACDLWRGEFEERGQTMTFEYGDEQKWYYLKEHRVDEVTLVKIWDSADVGGKCKLLYSVPLVRLVYDGLLLY